VDEMIARCKHIEFMEISDFLPGFDSAVGIGGKFALVAKRLDYGQLSNGCYSLPLGRREIVVRIDTSKVERQHGQIQWYVALREESADNGLNLKHFRLSTICPGIELYFRWTSMHEQMLGLYSVMAFIKDVLVPRIRSA
jgi:hypothetical protein